MPFSHVIITFKIVQHLALYLSINKKEKGGPYAAVPAWHKKYLLETFKKLYSLGEKISPSQMPVLPPGSKSRPTCSLLLSGLISLSLWIFFLLYFHLPTSVQASPEHQRNCQTRVVCTPVLLHVPHCPLSSFLLLSLRLKENLFILPTILRRFQFSKEVDLFYSLVGKRNVTFSSLLKHYFSCCKEKFNIV